MTEETLEKLLHRLLEGELDEAGRAELNAALLESAERRARYLSVSAIHAALSRHALAEQMLPDFVKPSHEVTGNTTSQPASRFHISLASLALLGVALIAGVSLILLQAPREKALATVVEAGGVQWKEGSPAPETGALPANQAMELAQGFLKLRFPSGATATLEAPCRFLVKEAETLTMMHGRVSVHAPEGAQGFRVDTPGGRFVDLGTEFGLAVGSDGNKPVVLTEVFTGEVEVLATPTPTRLMKGESRALVQDEGNPTLLTTLDESPILLVNHAKQLPTVTPRTDTDNLALGKPVFSPGFYARKHGSIFPPDRLTDGRLNDSGVPGDWAFWLAPNEQDGEFTVDLLQPETIARLAMQNTNNRGIGDRGTDTFTAYGSLDNLSFFPLVQGQLPRIRKSEREFPFHDFSFPPVHARYVKVVITSHYRHPDRPPTRTDHGGGLNEIRIFPK
ncbi:FecR family protein [Roseimicrobium gellanilyticum]|uniref:FecR family protein n=1 Tax=Roseimicrobium gellanilyticum TaxID=748857 RepID=A0A366HUX9_9BACT|nr:discoidin domain-containing protein [Roseimicrobium gellanilyticum]RBP47660.1 FecR family protein [Roseimicrobium gellanilyticum]